MCCSHAHASLDPICVCMRACMRENACSSVCIGVRPCTSVSMGARARLRVRVHVRVRVRVHGHVQERVCVRAYVHACVRGFGGSGDRQVADLVARAVVEPPQAARPVRVRAHSCAAQSSNRCPARACLCTCLQFISSHVSTTHMATHKSTHESTHTSAAHVHATAHAKYVHTRLISRCHRGCAACAHAMQTAAITM